MKYQYKPNTGGHAPGHLREAFCAAFDSSWMDGPPLEEWWEKLDDEEIIYFYDEKKQAWWDSLGLKERGLWLIGQLWNCTDYLPGWLYTELELEGRSTYAAAVRKLKMLMS